MKKIHYSDINRSTYMSLPLPKLIFLARKTSKIKKLKDCENGRYQQGARLIGANNNGGSAVMVDIDQPVADIAVVNGTTTLTPAAATLRARFIGQGYKQVNSVAFLVFKLLLLPISSRVFHLHYSLFIKSFFSVLVLIIYLCLETHIFPMVCFTWKIFQVCGQADVWGDGVVPEISAHLEGALNISLDGVYHSPVGSDDTTRPWYGSPAIVEQWIHHLVN